MTKYSLRKFIDDMLIPDLQKMVDQQLHYYAFSIICQAIEVLGSVFDQESLDDYGQSEARFSNAVTNFFKDPRYKNQHTKLFKVLRGPFIHQLRPGEAFLLASSKKDDINPDNHLKKDSDGRTFLIIERFLSDFSVAVEKFKKTCDKRKDLDVKKLDATFIVVSTVAPPILNVQAEATAPMVSFHPGYTTNSAAQTNTSESVNDLGMYSYSNETSTSIIGPRATGNGSGS